MDRGFIYINNSNLINNLNFLKVTTKKELCLVVKANAYGHGLEWAVKNAKKFGVKWFAVASVDEGIQVKKVFGESRVLLLAEPSKTQLENVCKLQLNLMMMFEFFPLIYQNFLVHILCDACLYQLLSEH